MFDPAASMNSVNAPSRVMSVLSFIYEVDYMSSRASRVFTPAFAIPVLLVGLLSGCAGKPIIQTEIVEKPVVVPCDVRIPPECKSRYAADRLSVNDDALTINRALRAEIEERWACEIKLLAAVRGCNKKMPPAPETETETKQRGS
jgi:hypothetical protein